MEVLEDVYEGEMVRFPGPWGFLLGKSVIIVVQDAELDILAEQPDQEIDLSLTFEKVTGSLRSVCEQARAAGHRTLIVAFDHFFHQYRPGQFEPRKSTPDRDEYIAKIAKVSRFAAQYGLGLELSLLSPLEIGPAYAQATGESGVWMHYRKGRRDTVTGAFSVQLLKQTQWVHNKGIVPLEDAGVRVFAFHERKIDGTPYRTVHPDWIVEITDCAQVEEIVSDEKLGAARQIRVFGQGRAEIGDCDRVLVVQQYRTPEMDYFSEKALPYLTALVDRYADAGVELRALYSDEMHIQQDWAYFQHHDNGQFALRYVTPGLAKAFAARHGKKYEDFARYLLYFCYGQEDFAHDLSPHEGIQHVFGDTPAAIRATALFRAHYYQLLQDGVVDLFAAAKRHAEGRMGHRLEARAHATWAESPTIDYWNAGPERLYAHAYEYTSNFVWSNTVHQAASACHDYFKWGDFLTGNGTDHCECGWADRNYVGLQMASSIGILNEIPYAYSAHWGMPAALSKRRQALEAAAGCAGSPTFGMVTGMAHRDVDVLFLYPLHLVAAEERFGSWMTQYAYANLVTQEKLIERGRVARGAIEMAGRRFGTVVVTFEPFPRPELMALLHALAETGGRVVWAGPPPLLDEEHQPVLDEWRSFFGVEYAPTRAEGLRAPGKVVTFAGRLEGVAPMTILTDFLVDRIYPVTPQKGVEAVATVKGRVVGTVRARPAGGTATFLGFRPRDDQSGSLGYDVRTWFAILQALGEYGDPGNTEALSRTGDYLCCRFPNGALALAPHFKDTEEDWDGGFGRDAERDAAYLERVPAPSDAIALADFRLGRHTLTYTGRHALAFRTAPDGALLAFAGGGAREIVVDGRRTVFADREIDEVGWAPVEPECQGRGGALVRLRASDAVTLTVPAVDLPAAVGVWAEGPTPGSRGERVAARREEGALVVTIAAEQANRWLFVAPQ